MCFDDALIASENKVSPAARSTLSTIDVVKQIICIQALAYIPGTTKLSNGVSSEIAALGRTNAPVDTSYTSGVLGDEGFVVNTTFAKCVGTEMFGGEPITS